MYTDDNIRERVSACEEKHNGTMRACKEKHEAHKRMLASIPQTVEGYTAEAHRLAMRGAMVEYCECLNKARSAMVREAGRIALGWGLP